MNTRIYVIQVNNISVNIVRKNIKNLHLAVYPPNGQVRIAAPDMISDEAIRLAIISKLGWIKRQQENFIEQPRQSNREIITGESHYFLGKRYIINVQYAESKTHVQIRNKKIIDITINPGTSQTNKQKILQEWYRSELKKIVPEIIRKWELKIGIKIKFWCIKRMKTKWGSCNTKFSRIWINLELAKKPVHCLEYIILHEVVHLLERKHCAQFIHYMDKLMPQWRIFQKDLNHLPLANEEWHNSL